MRKLIIAAVATLFVIPVFAKNRYIPVAGLTPGAQGSFWRTDLRIFNPSATHELEVSLHFLPAGVDGRNIPGRAFQIRPREVLVLDNVVATLAPHFPSVIGAIRIDSDTDASYDFVATSRTYTTSPDPQRPGTYGQFIPALDAGDATRESVILNVAQRPDVRTNFGVMNPSQTAATVKAIMFGFEGTPFLESPEFLVEPKSMRQWSMAELFGSAYVHEAYVVFEATTPVFTWGSVIDNLSGDGIFICGTEPRDEIEPLSIP